MVEKILNTTTREIRLENLIRSGQDVFNACGGSYQTNYLCGVTAAEFKCCYKSGKHCTYDSKIVRSYN